MRKLKTWELGRVSAEAFALADKLPLVVVLDNIRSGHNVGSVFRTADAFRVQKIFLCGYTCTPPHPDIYKTALGAEDTIPYEIAPSAAEVLSILKKEGYIVAGIEQTDTSTRLDQFIIEPGQRYAIVLGNEVNGVEEAALNLCDHILEIPQEGTKHSLNVSVATGIVLWEFFKKI